jgi:hypothetical protein
MALSSEFLKIFRCPRGTAHLPVQMKEFSAVVPMPSDWQAFSSGGGRSHKLPVFSDFAGRKPSGRGPAGPVHEAGPKNVSNCSRKGTASYEMYTADRVEGRTGCFCPSFFPARRGRGRDQSCFIMWTMDRDTPGRSETSRCPAST